MPRGCRAARLGGMNNTPQPGTFRIDTSRSVITFGTRHLFGLGAVRGTFQLRAGEIRISDPVDASAVRVTVDAASFDTGNFGRDRTVRSARLLDTGRYPAFTFASGKVTEDSGRWTLHGSLTVGAITRPVDLAIEQTQTAGHELTATASTGIDRYAFGVTGMKGLAARHLSCRIEIVATRSAL
jgi:polyisoprenoid-binding protein YceI